MPRPDTGPWSQVPGPRESFWWAIAGAIVAIIVIVALAVR
jgi:hypothetical protein